MNTNARLSPRKPWSSRRLAIVRAVSPGSTRNSTWAGSVDAGVVRAGPEVLGHDVLDERQLERGRVVLGDAQDRAVDHRPEGGQRDGQDDRGEDEGEDQELEQPDRPPPPDRPPRPSRPRGTGSENSGIGLGRVGVLDRTGGPASHGRPGGVRRSGSSWAGLLGVWGCG